MKSRKNVITFIVIVIVLILLILPKISLNDDNSGSPNPSSSGREALGINGKIIVTEPLQNKLYTNGTLFGNEEVELKSEISGRIIEIFFEEGKTVKKGEMLLKLNDADLQATLKKNMIREELAADKEHRALQLLEKKLTSQQEYDIALNELNSVKADIEYTKAQIAKTEIRAPFDGIIGLRWVSVGSYITPQSRVATLQSINNVKIDFSVPQKYYNEIKEGKEIEFKLPNTDNTFTGRIYALEPRIDETTRTLLVRAIAPNKNKLLAPGAYVEIEVILENITDAILVPTDVVVPDISGEKVFVYKNGNAVPHQVITGIRTETEIQILSGLNLGDTLITSGIIQLRPGSPVVLNNIE
ncbi:MAG: efflux RND transporter periplasmic adaptor subunit [Melioribacteraceae bacterium]|nr:efflux RND transporter periplasmic adaptor subunit [Melioribacteraceae bacterium]